MRWFSFSFKLPTLLRTSDFPRTRVRHRCDAARKLKLFDHVEFAYDLLIQSPVINRFDTASSLTTVALLNGQFNNEYAAQSVGQPPGEYYMIE